jgi:hypothetical protein
MKKITKIYNYIKFLESNSDYLELNDAILELLDSGIIKESKDKITLSESGLYSMFYLSKDFVNKTFDFDNIVKLKELFTILETVKLRSNIENIKIDFLNGNLFFYYNIGMKKELLSNLDSLYDNLYSLLIEKDNLVIKLILDIGTITDDLTFLIDVSFDYIEIDEEILFVEDINDDHINIVIEYFKKYDIKLINKTPNLYISSGTKFTFMGKF